MKVFRSPKMFLPGLLLGVVLAAVAPCALPGAVAAQSTLDRSPNIEGLWASRAGMVHFHFLHRFRLTDPPTRKVLNSPTFLLAAGLPHRLVIGGRYASNSVLVGGEPNEWEGFLRWMPLWREGGHPLDLGIQASYNGTAESLDGEVLLGREAGPFRLLAGVRGYSAFAGGGSEAALLGGGRLELHRHVALAGDAAKLVTADGADVAWSLGLQLGIPYTPHSLSLQVSNANTNTLQGSAVGVGDHRWGFEFTVPIRLGRYFGGGGENGKAEVAPPPADAEVEMTNRLRFLPDTVRIRVGEAVRWRNTSDLLHTVTADPEKATRSGSVRLPSGASSFDSGNLPPGEEFRHTFTVPGTYEYFCVPHEAAGMTGVVIVSQVTSSSVPSPGRRGAPFRHPR